MDDLKRFLATGSCCAEALVRLNDTGSFGQVSPDEFIPVAEKN